ncbi:MAG: DUF1565 domain-containing protein [Candidatus Gottesmanbacteria bacterium]
MKNNLNNLQKIFFITIFFIGIFGLAKSSQAAEYYVATNGNDNNPGSESQPWATFTYAISQMSNGDALIAKAGTYTQSFTVNKSITIQGTLDGDGNRLSIIDPYTNVSGGWTHSSDGVYTKTLGWKAWDMAIEIGGTRYKIYRLCELEDCIGCTPGVEPYIRYQSYCSNWWDFLIKPNAGGYQGRWSTPDLYSQINFWDGYEVLFTSQNDGDTFIRFRAGDNPNSYTLYASQHSDIYDTKTITVTASNVTIKDLEIHPKQYGIFASGNYSNITINSNKIILGKKKVHIEGGNGHIISNNIMTDQSYSDAYVQTYNSGAWGTSPAYYSYANTVRQHKYQFMKYGVCSDSPQSEGMGVWLNVASAIVDNNDMSYMNQGVETWYSAGFEIKNNYFHNMPSVAWSGDSSFNAMANGSIHDNTFSHINFHLRPQSWGGTADGSWSNTANLRIYNNKFWNPTHYGGGMYFHFDSGTHTMPNTGIAWIYHNSFSGGHNAIQVSSLAAGYSPEPMSKVYLINNVVSSYYDYYDQSYASPLGGCWYNWLAGTMKDGGCSHASNIDNGTTLMWDTSSIHDFVLPVGCSAIEAGKDISSTFTIDSVPYAALAGFSPGYFPGTAPNMGAWQSNQFDTTPPASPSGLIIN